MSAPSILPCPEPMPYSNDSSSYADVDFGEARAAAVFSNQPRMVPVDSLLSNQLGPITNPVMSPSSSVPQQVIGAPILPTVEESNAKPMLSSYAGADINSSSTLSQTTPPNFVSVNDLVYAPSNTSMNVLPAPLIQTFKTEIPGKRINQANPVNYTKPIPRSQPILKPVNKPSLKTVESFGNNNQNLAKFIDRSSKPAPKLIRKVEHFNFQKMSLMDNIILAILIGAIIYYIVSLKHSNMADLSKIPIVSQLSDKNVSNENKLIIIVAVVIALILIRRMLK